MKRASETLRKHYFQPIHLKRYLSIVRFVILQAHVRSCFIGLAETDSDYVCKLLKGSVASLCGCTGFSGHLYNKKPFPWTDTLSFIYLGYVSLMDNVAVLWLFNSILAITESTGMLMKSSVPIKAIRIRLEPHMLQDSNPRPRDPKCYSFVAF